MKFSPPLEQGVLIQRYKRFLADVKRGDGSEITIHCPNTGSMKNCNVPGSAVWFSDSANDKRKYRHTWEAVSTPLGFVAGVNTGLPNKLVKEAIESDVVKPLQGYDSLRMEVPYGKEKSRIDLLLESGSKQCYVEIKNVTLEQSKTVGLFPDAVTTRGAKHLRELIQVKKNGQRAVLFFCVQHTGIKTVKPAYEIDPVYGETLREAVAAGVEVIAYGARISADEIKLTRKVVFKLD